MLVIPTEEAYPGTGYLYGRAYLFYGNERNLIDTRHDYIYGSSCETASFLCAVSAGDVNGDGYTDALLGERGYTIAGAEHPFTMDLSTMKAISP